MLNLKGKNITFVQPSDLGERGAGGWGLPSGRWQKQKGSAQQNEPFLGSLAQVSQLDQFERTYRIHFDRLRYSR